MKIVWTHIKMFFILIHKNTLRILFGVVFWAIVENVTDNDQNQFGSISVSTIHMMSVSLNV